MIAVELKLPQILKYYFMKSIQMFVLNRMGIFKKKSQLLLTPFIHP